MITVNYHGGGCCGVRHIYNFTGTRTEAVEEGIKTAVSRLSSAGLYEIVLTGAQLRRRPAIAKIIQELGFRFVTRFKNPNSGNICYVFHWVKNHASKATAMPFKIIEKEVG